MSGSIPSFTDDAVVLKRIEYGEADRIITFLTKDNGQIRAIAKGVRRPKSKLAGGLEILSISKVTFMKARGDLHLVRSARMDIHFGEIIKDYDKLQFAYGVIGHTYTMTEDMADDGVFDLLRVALESLNNNKIDIAVTQLWFYSRGLMILGQQPNLSEDIGGEKLEQGVDYDFSVGQGGFVRGGGKFSSEHIKVLRLLAKTDPEVSIKVAGLVSPAQEICNKYGHLFDRVMALGA